MYFLAFNRGDDAMRMKITVEPIVFMYNIAYTVQLSLQQDFIFARLCNEHYSAQMCDNWWLEKKVAWVERAAVRRVMWMSITTGLVAVFASQLLGAALDKYSQKLVMLAPFFGSLALSVVCLVVAAVPTASLDLLYIGAAINGAAGGFVVFKASVSTYIVGISAAEEWTDRLSIVESMLFLGSAVGPLGLQFLILYCTTYHSLLFLGCEIVVAMAIVYIIALLPDHKYNSPKPNSHNTENNNTQSINNNTNSQNTDNNNTQCVNNNTNYEAISDTTFNPSSSSCSSCSCSCSSCSSCSSRFVIRFKVFFRGLSDAFSATFRRRAAGVRLAIVALLLADFFIAIVFAAEFDLLYLYMQDRFGLTLPEYSRYLGIKNIVNGISLLIILPSMRRFFGLSDVALGILGGLSRVAAFLLLGSTSSGRLVYLGRVMTIVSAMAQLSLLMGSLIFDMLYPIFVSLNLPGATFLLAAGCLGTSTIILGYVNWHLKRVKNCEELRPLIQPVE
ncbi:uncharacterized protein LOC125041375 isoform X2 [Penaeus chinensis]|uniref:uncharacterized protein LOC125041375 isoform X2 n=1 Tax=Penaeus chinensis TaxID=139456 RepID=UPI001FB71E20|nr:uncharacterized protein LOC125041375 isoform X2 [Penaeus chinensis]